MVGRQVRTSAKEWGYGCGINYEDAIWVPTYSYYDFQQISWGFKNLDLCTPIFWQK